MTNNYIQPALHNLGPQHVQVPPSHSPTRIAFNYVSRQPSPQATHQQFKIQRSINHSPQLIHTGFVVGEPVAFSEKPELPLNYKQFSPKRSQVQSYITVNSNERMRRSSENVSYRIQEVPRPEQFAYNLPSSRFQKESNYSLERQYSILKQKYVQLEKKYMYENRQGSGVNLSEQVLVNLIEKARQSILEQSRLLVDRYRLEIKNLELENSHLKKEMRTSKRESIHSKKVVYPH